MCIYGYMRGHRGNLVHSKTNKYFQCKMDYIIWASARQNAKGALVKPYPANNFNSEDVACFSSPLYIFKLTSDYILLWKQNIWTLTRLLFCSGQSAMGPNHMQLRLPKNISRRGAGGKSIDWPWRGCDYYRPHYVGLTYNALKYYYISGVMYLIGCIVFAVKFKENYIDPVTRDCELSYCFIISTIALVLEILAGVLMIIDAKKAGTSPSG